MTETRSAPGALDGLVVLDLSRILAGPTATQLLGDLGATVWKIEAPGAGDDTRGWGPPYVPDPDGGGSDVSAYFMAANRNKRSVALDLADPAAQATVLRLAARADVVVENFKPGGLVKYGLDHATVRARHPGLVWCSISGFGQTGPHRDKPGYDLLAQGYGGIMSLTGEPDGRPMKVGVGIADVMCGMYATVGILAALRHRDRTGEGQHIDLALVDAQVAWLINEGVNTLTSGVAPQRRGNGHPNIVPYDVFAASDGHVIVAVGNDGQFARFCDFLGLPGLAAEADFATNSARVVNRDRLIPVLSAALAALTRDQIVAGLEARKVPVGPVQRVDEVLASDQVAARGGVVTMEHPTLGPVRVLGNPLKLSVTPVRYTHAPPRLDEGRAALDAFLGDQPG
ncbi:MAG: CoA transferase [Rhodobacteraceae bacterium]|nr:CoA transferase [Paracoccaceae bacterium]